MARDLEKAKINSRVWRERNPEKARAATKAWQQRNAKKLRLDARRKNLRKNYGMTIEDYERMATNQCWSCAICDSSVPSSRRLAVDHSHKTGRVRGLLCLRCNVSLERLETIPLWHEKALRYIEENEK